MNTLAYTKFKYHTLSTQNIKIVTAIAQNKKYGLRTFSYVGSHLWNSVLNHCGGIAPINYNEFKALLSAWKGPDIF